MQKCFCANGIDEGLQTCAADGSSFDACSGCRVRPKHGEDGNFTEIAQSLGLPLSGGPCLGLDDFDGDGKLDLLLSRVSGPVNPMTGAAADVYVYSNVGGGKFSSEPVAKLAAGLSMVCTTGDVDNDGDIDVVVGQGNQMSMGYLRLFRNDGGFKFTFVEDGITPASVSDFMLLALGMFDYDNDGFLDLAVGRSFASGGPLDSEKCKFSPTYDDYTCIVGASSFNQPTLIFRNAQGKQLKEQAGMLSGPYPFTTNAIAFADFDGNGLQDMFLSNDWYSNHLQMQMQPSVFEHKEQPLGLYDFNHGMGAAINDYDGDGNLDVYGADLGPNNFWFGKKDGSFENFKNQIGISKVTRYHSSWAPIGEDFNLDGLPDVFVATSGVVDNDEDMAKMALVAGKITKQVTQLDLVFWNHGDRQFVGANLPHRPGQEAAVIVGSSAAGDYDGDGDIDIVVASGGDLQLRFLRNDSKPANYLIVDLQGTKSNRDGVGAEVKLMKNGAVAQRRILGTQGSVGASWHRVHFGLGSDPSVDELRVRWPSGKVQTVGPVKANQTLTIVEP